MKIIKLQAENIKKLIAVEIEPTGNVVKITGRNGAGKTSVMDSIFWALGGTEGVQKQPIRKGEKRGEITLDLGDLIVRRTFTESGSTLYVENKEGARFKSPQTLLDGLIGRMCFDPLAFMRMDPRQQFQALRDMTGVDLSDLEAQQAKTYQDRTVVNREVESLKARVTALVVPPDAPDSEQDAAALAAQFTKAVETNKVNASAKQQLTNLQTELKEVEKQIYDLTIRSAELAGRIEKGRGYCAGLVDIDEQALQQQLATVETRNKAARAKQDRRRLQDELKAATDQSEGMTASLAAIAAEKQKRIAAATFPLPGLGFGEGVVVYNGLPLEQASSAEQLRVSLSMAMALNPKLRIIRVSDGSLLDAASMAIVEEMAAAGDYQVWMEVVDETGKVGIVIEDGQVAAVNDNGAASARGAA